MDPIRPVCEYRYEVDAEDVISSVSSEWLSFAEENGAPDLARDVVIGSSLWTFVAGAETRHLYRSLFGKARDGGLPIAVPFRCDAPERRRFMRLTITPSVHGSLVLIGVLLREEDRRHLRLLERGRGTSADLITMCGWCKRILVEAGEWLDPEAAIDRMGLFELTEVPRITHGICAACMDVVERELEA